MSLARRSGLTAVIAGSLLASGVANAVNIDIDLDGALGFFVNPDPNYSVVINLANPITYTPGEVLPIWINFVDLDGSGGNGIGAKQHLEVSDLANHGFPPPAAPNPMQDINVFLNGPNVPNANALFDIEFTGVTLSPGTVLSGTTLTNLAGNCVASLFCTSGPEGADLIQGNENTDRSFFFHDFHITFQTDGFTGAPFDITALSFGGAADAVQIGTWPVPLPGTLALLGFGLAGLGVSLARRR